MPMLGTESCAHWFEGEELQEILVSLCQGNRTLRNSKFVHNTSAATGSLSDGQPYVVGYSQYGSRLPKGIYFEFDDYRVIGQTSPEQDWYRATLPHATEAHSYLTKRDWRIVHTVDLTERDMSPYKDSEPDISHTYLPPEGVCRTCPNFLVCTLEGRFP